MPLQVPLMRVQVLVQRLAWRLQLRLGLVWGQLPGLAQVLVLVLA